MYITGRLAPVVILVLPHWIIFHFASLFYQLIVGIFLRATVVSSPTTMNPLKHSARLCVDT